MSDEMKRGEIICVSASSPGIEPHLRFCDGLDARRETASNATGPIGSPLTPGAQ